MTQGSLPTLTAEDLWRKEWRLQQHTEPITKLFPLQTASSGSNKLISISKDASVKVYRGHDFHPLQSITSKHSASETPSWPSDAALLSLQGHQKLVISSHDRSLAFYNVLLAENDPERPDEHSCLGLGGNLTIPAPGHAATSLASLPFHCSNHEEQHQQRLVFGDETGKVQLLKRSAPSMGLTATLDMKTDVEQLHNNHTASITQLLHTPHVGLLSSSLDGTIGIFDAERGRVAATTGTLHKGHAVRCMAYHDPLTLAVSGGAGRSALLWHPRGDPGKSVGELPGHVHGVLSICTVATQSSTTTTTTTADHVVVTLSGVGTVTVFDLRTLRPLYKMEGTEDYLSHEDARPTALAVDQERNRVVTATKRPCAWSFFEKGKSKENASMGENMRLRLRLPRRDSTTPKTTTETEKNLLGASGCDVEKEKTKEDEEREEVEGSWQQAHSRLRLATIPDL